MVVIVLKTYWTKDYWYKSNNAPYQTTHIHIEPWIAELPRQRYLAVEYTGRDHLKVPVLIEPLKPFLSLCQ